MATKSILLAIADQQALADISQALGAEWMPTPVGTEAEALAQLDKYAFEALLVDFNLGSPDASDLLNQALAKRPQTARFLLAHEADLALVAAKVEGTHQILPKPLELASLRSRLEDGVRPEATSHGQPAADAANGAEAKPSVPAIYAELLKAFDSPEVTPAQIGSLLAQDAELSAEVLRLASSAYLRSPRPCTDLVEAVNSLGLPAVKGLIQALRFLAENSHLRPGYLSLEQLWQHSTTVAQIARDLVLFETRDRALAGEAFVAGLVHDLGKVVLVTNFDDLYCRVHSLARKQPVAIWEAEKEMFGASHGEIGGCLVGMWNLPGSAVEAAALHHEPPLGENRQLTPLAAVHIANVLAHELVPSEEFRIAPVIDTRLLNELGLLQRLPLWRAAIANGVAGDFGAEAELAQTTEAAPSSPGAYSTPISRTANQLSGPVTSTRSATSGHPLPSHAPAVAGWGAGFRRWVYAGVAAALFLWVGFWLSNKPEPQAPLTVYARSRTPAPVPAKATPMPAPIAAASRESTGGSEPSKPSAPPTRAAAPAPVQLAMVNTQPSAAPASTAPANPAPAPALVRAAVAAPAKPASAAPAKAPLPQTSVPKPAQPEFRLNTIFYTVDRPSAVVNGKMVWPGDRVGEAIVLSIGRNQVTLKVHGETRTFVLH